MKKFLAANTLLSIFVLVILSVTSTACMQQRTALHLSETIPEIDKDREPKMLTAFFGLDNGLTKITRFIYKGAPGKDGMPVVFSHEIDPATLEGRHFEITTQDGSKVLAEAAVLPPANEAFELRTVLLIGEYGNHPDNPPVAVKIVGDLMSRTGYNFKGQSISVIPLPDGPVLSYAEYFTFTDDYPYVKKGRGCDCPKEETNIVVRAVWSGGVRAVNGKELGDKEIEAFKVTMVKNKDTITATPFKLADLGDNDNNIDLCLKEEGIPIMLTVDEHIAIDPRDDLNPTTEIEVVSRW